MTNTPIFESVFGRHWRDMPPVMHKHYANRPFSRDIVTVDGTLDVMCAGPLKVLAPLLWLLRGIPPHTEQAVPVTVCFASDQSSRSFHFNRTFHFKKRRAYCFKSRMIQREGNEVVEVMRSGLGWRMNYLWEDDRVKLKHRGYVFSLFGHFLPLPLTFLIGKGYAEEIAIDEDSFSMIMTLTHPWWGKIYEYKGHFKVRGSL